MDLAPDFWNEVDSILQREARTVLVIVIHASRTLCLRRGINERGSEHEELARPEIKCGKSEEISSSCMWVNASGFGGGGCASRTSTLWMMRIFWRCSKLWRSFKRFVKGHWDSPFAYGIHVYYKVRGIRSYACLYFCSHRLGYNREQGTKIHFPYLYSNGCLMIPSSHIIRHATWKKFEDKLQWGCFSIMFKRDTGKLCRGRRKLPSRPVQKSHT